MLRTVATGRAGYVLSRALVLCVLQGAEIWTPVFLASYENQIEVLEVLIHHGAQLAVRNKVLLLHFLPNIVYL